MQFCGAVACGQQMGLSSSSFYALVVNKGQLVSGLITYLASITVPTYQLFSRATSQISYRAAGVVLEHFAVLSIFSGETLCYGLFADYHLRRLGIDVRNLSPNKTTHCRIVVIISVNRPDHGTANADAVCPLQLRFERVGIIIRYPLILVPNDVLDSSFLVMNWL